jgi:serine protease Do
MILMVLVPWLLVSSVQASDLRRDAVVRAVRQCRPSVVNIHGEKTIAASYDGYGHAGEPPRHVNGMGTGVVVDKRGYIVTNYHVVNGVRRIQVTMADGKTYLAQLVSFDKDSDLAVIKVDAPVDLPVISIGTSSDLMPGETVIAMGNAYGYEHTVTLGIVSALHRTVQVSDTQQYADLIQTDASINPGNSGGPLLNIDGEMIGVNVAVRAGAQGIGFAIPVDKVLETTATLLSAENVDHNWHGIAVNADPAGEQGAVVAAVDADSPAAKGGVQPGDVITGINGQIIDRPLDFQRALLERKPGEEIEVAVERNHEPLKLSFVMAERHTRRPSVEERTWNVLGLRLRSLTPGESRGWNARYRGGLAVVEVRPGGPAAAQGIRPGDVLVGMHIWETISLDNVAYVLNRDDLAQLMPLKFYIVRGRETLFGHLTLADTTRR